MRISFVIPFRSTEPDRIRNRDWTASWIAAIHPNAEIIHAADDGIDPFSKTVAFNRGVAASTGDVLVLFDADCLPVRSRAGVWIRHSAAMLASGQARWAKAARAHWLTPEASDRVRSKSPRGYLPVPERSDVLGRGPISGLLTMVTRKAWHQVRGMDPRFRGWGGEDDAWCVKLSAMLGQPHRGGDVAHLYHQHLRAGGYTGRTFAEGGIPLWQGQTIRNTELRGRYAAAARKRDQMQALICEYQYE